MIEISVISFTAYPQLERYYNPDTCYGVYTFYTHDNIQEGKVYFPTELDANFDDSSKPVNMSILAGSMQQLYLGSEYKVEAELEYNKKYKSYQYRPVSILAVTPKTVPQQKMFLQAIISPAKADVLMAAYPNIIEDVINNRDRVDVSKLKGIGDTTWEKIRESIINNYVISDILVMLQPLGVTYKTIEKLVESEPNPALLKAQLIDNPYIMTRIHGLGFKKVDDLALKLNPCIRVSNKRTYAFIRWYLNDIAKQEGHTWAYISKLTSAAKENIPECIDLLKDIIELESKNNVAFKLVDNKIGLIKNYELEMNAYAILMSLNKTKVNWNLNYEKGIFDAERQQGFEYTQEQREIIKRAVESNVTIISGKAGTGKTSISRGILNIYKNASKSIACCALSAKAAQRITEATGYRSSTIHRLLGGDGRGGFKYCHDNPLDYDVVFLDEASMINISLFYSLVSAIKKGSRIVICGDNRQLPPIGEGNIFSDLLDRCYSFNVNKLTKVLRQAEDSGILSDANKIREGINPLEQIDSKVVTGKLQDMVYMFRESPEVIRNIAIRTFLKSIEQDGIDNVVIVTPRKQSCVNSTQEINKIIASVLFRDVPKDEGVSCRDITYLPGMKVMQLTNNYDKKVFNGEIGYVQTVYTDRDHKKVLVVKYSMNDEEKYIEYRPNELAEIDLAYALTVHKCQGSGYKTVISIVDTSHYVMLDSCLLYTALTRAKKRCLLLATSQAFAKCISTNKSIIRQTWLSEMKPN